MSTSNINEIINSLSKMNIIEIMELTKAIEKKFDISMNAMLQEPINNENKQNKETKTNEKTTCSVIMTSYGASKLNVIKTVRTMLNLGLKDAKDFVENLPATIKKDILKNDANSIKNELENCGAKIELK